MISGKFDHAKQPYFILSQILPEELLTIDTVLMIKGSFSYRIRTEQVGVYLMQFSDTTFISFIANRGDHLVFSGDMLHLSKTYHVSGNKETDLLIESRHKLDELYDQTELLSQMFLQHTYRDDYDSVKHVVDSLYAVSVALHKQYLTTFILAHPDKLASLLAFYQMLGNHAFFSMEEDNATLHAIFPALSKEYPESIYIQNLEEKLNESK